MEQHVLVTVTLVGRVGLDLFDSKPRLLAVASDCLMDALSLISMLFFNEHLVFSDILPAFFPFLLPSLVGFGFQSIVVM